MEDLSENFRLSWSRWIIKDTLEFHSADGERAVMPVGNTHQAMDEGKDKAF